jgi:hypothetical protein
MAMALPDWLTTHELSDAFGEQIKGMGGRVSECFDDGERLIERSILPDACEVRRGDALQGGVALMAANHEVRVHPYVFRKVCSNGAIMAHAVQTQRIEVPEWPADLESFMGHVCETVRACAAADAFAGGVAEVRSAIDREADFALTVLPLLDRLPEAVRVTMMGMIAGRFFSGEDRSRYGLVNAVTSVARDTTDPDLKWRLEEIGGRVAGMQPVPRRQVGMMLTRRAHSYAERMGAPRPGVAEREHVRI